MSSENIEKMCELVSKELWESELEAAVKTDDKCPPELFELTKDLQYHMNWHTAERRQRILTEQFIHLAAFPGHHTNNDLFFSNEFWYDKVEISEYFEEFETKWSTKHVEVVLNPLFGTKPCFHLQMMNHYEMPPFSENWEWRAATKAWRDDCSLDR
jgi:hypothetical protein